MRDLRIMAKDIRKIVIDMHACSGASHIGSALSIVDILTVLYFKVLNIDKVLIKKESRNRFILSKGHGASALYATLYKKGMIEDRHIRTYCRNGGLLAGHTDNFRVDGIEAATGSLGHGLPIACGMALSSKNNGWKSKIYVLLGDGECDEGSVWEAAMFASHRKLDNLTAIIDRNKLQGMGGTEEVLALEPLSDKWKSFGWAVKSINGHSLKSIESALLRTPLKKGRPSVIIANTYKGKGVSFMENRLEWHYKSPTANERQKALEELEIDK